MLDDEMMKNKIIKIKIMTGGIGCWTSQQLKTNYDLFPFDLIAIAVCIPYLQMCFFPEADHVVSTL